MKPCLVAVLTVALVAVSGCVTVERDPLLRREQAYQRLADQIVPGMKRRQLYALLPPAETPTFETYDLRPGVASAGRPFWVDGPRSSIHGLVAVTYPLWVEDHILDEEFKLSVCYEPFAGQVKFRPPGQGILPDFVTSSSEPIPQNLIDQFLFGPSPKVIRRRSKQNMNDSLLFPPKVVRRGGEK